MLIDIGEQTNPKEPFKSLNNAAIRFICLLMQTDKWLYTWESIDYDDLDYDDELVEK